MNNFTRPMAAALAALALAASAVPNASLRKTETNVKPEGTVVDSISDDIRRPVPTEFETGNTYDDLLYYDSDTLENRYLFEALPEGEKIIGDEVFLAQIEALPESQNYTVDMVNVEGEDFTEAAKVVHSRELPYDNNPLDDFVLETSADYIDAAWAQADKQMVPKYNVQFTVSADIPKADDGDIMLISLKMKSCDRDIENNPVVQMQAKLTDKNGNKLGSAKGETLNKHVWGTGYVTYYLPFEYKQGCETLSITIGAAAKCGDSVEYGGFKVVNYGKSATMDQMPNGAEGVSSYAKDAEWRREAWERIEQNRKGDVTVTVKDSKGNVIPDATVDFDMYEHEFWFGTAINSWLYSGDEAEIYTAKFLENFNSAVHEGAAHWWSVMNGNRTIIDAFNYLNEIGITKIRSHALLYEIPNGLYSNVDLPIGRDEYLEAAKERIRDGSEMLSAYTKEWDVFNEAVTQGVSRNLYGNDMMLEYFKTAREALGEEGVLTYNDFDITNEYFDLVEWMVENGADIDILGLQSHRHESYYEMDNIEQEILFMEECAKIVDRLKVTEFTFATEDLEMQANYVRDFLIAAFAQPEMEGFILWKYRNDAHEGWEGPNCYILYDENWNLRLAGKVWQDLIYNKWWTRESLMTDENGKVSLRGFYGDYDVTVTTADGRTKTVSIPLHKGVESNFIIVVD